MAPGSENIGAVAGAAASSARKAPIQLLLSRASVVKGVPVDERAPNDVLDWTGGVGDRSLVLAAEKPSPPATAKRSPKGTLDRPSGGVGVGGGPSPVAAGDRRPPRLRYDGSGAPE